MEKFESEFGYFPEDDEDNAQEDDHEYLNTRGNSTSEGARKHANAAKLKSKKPDDWLATFRDNIDDDFKVLGECYF